MNFYLVSQNWNLSRHTPVVSNYLSIPAMIQSKRSCLTYLVDVLAVLSCHSSSQGQVSAYCIIFMLVEEL